MPCRCDDMGPTPGAIKAEKQRKRNIELMGQMSCAALGFIEANGYMMEFEQTIEPEENGFEVKEMRGWWANHKREDEARRKREAKEKAEQEEKQKREEKRAKVLSELSDEQLEALGFKRIENKKDKRAIMK